jgi:hypothetical protein
MPVIAVPPKPDEKTEVKPVPTPATGEAIHSDTGIAEAEATAADDLEDRFQASIEGHGFRHEPELNPSEHVGESFQKVPPEFGFGVEFGNEDHAERK